MNFILLSRFLPRSNTLVHPLTNDIYTVTGLHAPWPPHYSLVQILSVLQWAKEPWRPHRLCCRLPGHILESPSSGTPTPLGNFLQNIFGASSPQRTRQTLTRTFHEFLSVLEDSINSELTHSTLLFTLFDSDPTRSKDPYNIRHPSCRTNNMVSCIWLLR